jgi:transposase-like protein
MAAGEKLPTNLVEAVRYFSDQDVCVAFIAKLRWPDGPTCPACGGKEHSYLTTRRLWKCKACKKQYSVKVGTIFEDSAIPLDKWLASIWLIANSKNGISSHELGRAVGLNQKSAWFVLHRIRLAMQSRTFDRFEGEVEADETYIGGKSINMHRSTRRRRIPAGPTGKGSGGSGKAIVAGVMERGGHVRTAVMPDTQRETLRNHIRRNVTAGSTVYTDAHPAHKGLGELVYSHHVIDHAVAYVNGRVHTNSLENFWSLVKRGLKGTYVSVDPSHLFRYLDERCYTFNERCLTDYGRFEKVLHASFGRRLTWAGLTTKL